jgi:hypothetical protein
MLSSPRDTARVGQAYYSLSLCANGGTNPGLAHVVLEQFAQRLDQFEVQRFRQAARVVVALDGLALLALAGAFDHVGVNRALRQPLAAGSLPASAWAMGKRVNLGDFHHRSISVRSDKETAH